MAWKSWHVLRGAHHTLAESLTHPAGRGVACRGDRCLCSRGLELGHQAARRGESPGSQAPTQTGPPVAAMTVSPLYLRVSLGELLVTSVTRVLASFPRCD